MYIKTWLSYRLLKFCSCFPCIVQTGEFLSRYLQVHWFSFCCLLSILQLISSSEILIMVTIHCGFKISICVFFIPSTSFMILYILTFVSRMFTMVHLITFIIAVLKSLAYNFNIHFILLLASVIFHASWDLHGSLFTNNFGNGVERICFKTCSTQKIL